MRMDLGTSRATLISSMSDHEEVVDEPNFSDAGKTKGSLTLISLSRLFFKQ